MALEGTVASRHMRAALRVLKKRVEERRKQAELEAREDAAVADNHFQRRQERARELVSVRPVRFAERKYARMKKFGADFFIAQTAVEGSWSRRDREVQTHPPSEWQLKRAHYHCVFVLREHKLVAELLRGIDWSGYTMATSAGQVQLYVRGLYQAIEDALIERECGEWAVKSTAASAAPSATPD